MDVFGTIAHWAGDAWNGLTSLGGDAESALSSMWSFVNSIYDGFGWLEQTILFPELLNITTVLHGLRYLVSDTRDALDRVGWWVYQYMVTPVRATLQLEIGLLKLWAMVEFAHVIKLMYLLDALQTVRTDILVGREREQRIAGVNAAKAFAQTLKNQLHVTIENEAVAGYKAGLGIRTTIVQQLAQDLNARGLLDKLTTELLVKAIDTVMVIDDPALAAVANRIVRAIIAKTGLGQDIADLIDRLITPGAGGAAPKNLTGVIADITHRLGQIEQWITEFMLDGGPELEDVGKQLKTINSLTVDAALLLFFGQAVTSPVTWAKEVNDTVGTLVNETLGRIMDLISHA